MTKFHEPIQANLLTVAKDVFLHGQVAHFQVFLTLRHRSLSALDASMRPPVVNFFRLLPFFT
jgi:hypothetical protein